MSFLMRFLGPLTSFSLDVFLAMRGTFVGTDGFGNKYYRSKARKGYNHDRRFVVYKGAPEASKVPPEWHGWLHYQTDVVPTSDGMSYRKDWQLPAQVNPTGTNAAYAPDGFKGQRPRVSADYTPWKPE